MNYLNISTNYDIVIVSHEKDFYKIKYILENAKKNLIFDEVHLILSERGEFKDKSIIEQLNLNVYYHNEVDVLKIDKTRIKHRPNWIYQMMLKFFQNVTKNDNYLIIESDSIINSNLNFFTDGKSTFFLGKDQYHQAYFNFNKRLLDLDRVYDHSFISECMMYNKNIVKEILIKTNCVSVDDFLQKIYDIVDDNCYPADYELYGNFCIKYFNDFYNVQKIPYSQNGRWEIWMEDEIKSIINNNTDKSIISFHNYCW